MEQQTPEPQPPALPSTYHYATRHDGWTGEKMATFCEALAETAIVADACEIAHMGMSGAYAARRRIPVFAAAWEAALSIARERLADTLLERAMTGTRELYFKDGEVVGERHSIDNRLGLQILRRLDRLSETSMRSCEGRSPVPAKNSGPLRPQGHRHHRLGRSPWRRSAPATTKASRRRWRSSTNAKWRKWRETPIFHFAPKKRKVLDLSERCWFCEVDECWLTDFPPPPGFTGYESRDYDEKDEDESYERACTAEEIESWKPSSRRPSRGARRGRNAERRMVRAAAKRSPD